jgi:hypothetical protein
MQCRFPIIFQRTPTPQKLVDKPVTFIYTKIIKGVFLHMGKLKNHVIEIEEQVFEWYLDGIGEKQAISLAEKSFGSIGSQIAQKIYEYGEDYYNAE